MNPAPILEAITARETVAGLAADQLREQISTLCEQLTALETELADLSTTRTTLLRLTGHPNGDGPHTDTAPGNPTYQQILAVFATAELSVLAGRPPTRSPCRTTADGPATTAPRGSSASAARTRPLRLPPAATTTSR